ncbi:MAG: polysaccharide biosynthesis/export family protein [Bacteroidales bacterium]
MINNSRRNALALCMLCGVLMLNSCKSVKDVGYFQDIDKVGIIQSMQQNSTGYSTIIQTDDLLTITVSGIDPLSVAPFNLPALSYIKPGEKEMSNSVAIQSYLVSAEGMIDFPVIGTLKVAGLTKKECVELVKEKVSQYVKNPIVNLQFVNFKISVLGEVNRPGAIVVPNERVTILDAVGMAGDLTIYGERKNVLLIREKNGHKEFHRFDLTSSDLFNSPYYYLQQNDVVYVEPNVPRKKNARFSQTDQYNLSMVSTIVSVVSVVASLVIALLVK